MIGIKAIWATTPTIQTSLGYMPQLMKRLKRKRKGEIRSSDSFRAQPHYFCNFLYLQYVKDIYFLMIQVLLERIGKSLYTYSKLIKSFTGYTESPF